MKIEKAKIVKIPRSIYDKMLEHCYRKLEKKYYDYEFKNKRHMDFYQGKF